MASTQLALKESLKESEEKASSPLQSQQKSAKRCKQASARAVKKEPGGKQEEHENDSAVHSELDVSALVIRLKLRRDSLCHLYHSKKASG